MSVSPKSSVTTGVIFQVCEVEPATQLLPVLPCAYMVATLMRGTVEAYSFARPYLVDIHGKLKILQNINITEWGMKPNVDYAYIGQKLLATQHPLMEAIYAAFNHHYPLTLSPDHIWLLLCQGLANHVKKNAETLRHKFVPHEGKLTLDVRRDDFIKGSPANDWEGVFAEFAVQIRDHIGATANLITADFSTTTPVEQAAFNITLMDIVQEYFEFMVRTMCGVPAITLEGTVDDWQALLKRFEQFKQFGLEWWVEAVTPLLEEFVNAAKGQVNVNFWQDIFKQYKMSGGPYINGWIINFFPYVSNHRHELIENAYIRDPESMKKAWGDGLTLGQFPEAMPVVPFKWLFPLTNETFEMYFSAGFIGFSQDEQSKALRPEIGWGVMEKSASMSNRIDLSDYVDPFSLLTEHSTKEEKRLAAMNDVNKDIIVLCQSGKLIFEDYLKYAAEVEARKGGASRKGDH